MSVLLPSRPMNYFLRNCENVKKKTNTISHNVKESEILFGQIHSQIDWDLTWPMSHPPTKFSGNLLSSFWGNNADTSNGDWMCAHESTYWRYIMACGLSWITTFPPRNSPERCDSCCAHKSWLILVFGPERSHWECLTITSLVNSFSCATAYPSWSDDHWRVDNMATESVFPMLKAFWTVRRNINLAERVTPRCRTYLYVMWKTDLRTMDTRPSAALRGQVEEPDLSDPFSGTDLHPPLCVNLTWSHNINQLLVLYGKTISCWQISKLSLPWNIMHKMSK